MSRFGRKSDSRGLGDDIAKFTKLTKIDKVVKFATKSVGISDCGCSGRQDKANEFWPYNKK